METKVGWIGTGVMGHSMAMRLLKKNIPLVVHNRSKSKTKELIKEGALWAESPSEVAKQADVIFQMVGLPDDVEECTLGEKGVLEGISEGKIFVDMTTSSPSLAQKIGEAFKAKKVLTLDAPVSGGDIGAREGTLSIMVGGDEKAFQSLEKFWDILGKTVVYQGLHGAGQHTKMVNQVLIATNMIGVCEGLLYAYRSGMDPWKVLESVESGAAASWSLSQLGRRVLDKNFEPGFYVEHFIKDMGLALDEAKKMNLSLPGLALAHQLYIALKAQGGGKKGTQALFLALSELSPSME